MFSQVTGDQYTGFEHLKGIIQPSSRGRGEGRIPHMGCPTSQNSCESAGRDDPPREQRDIESPVLLELVGLRAGRDVPH